MRIIAGSRKSIALKTPKGMDTRPTMDRTKETLFNILSPTLYESRFLDLFSGSGSMGLEALSRGADYAVLVEKNKKATVCIEDNIQITKFESQTRLLKMDVLHAISLLEEEGQVFDIIFIDPPFSKGLEKDVLTRLNHSSVLQKEALVVVEASAETDFTYIEGLDFKITREKSYKTHKHIFLSQTCF